MSEPDRLSDRARTVDPSEIDRTGIGICDECERIRDLGPEGLCRECEDDVVAVEGGDPS